MNLWERWRPHDPKGNSLWLLPSGPDQVGEAFARTISTADMAAGRGGIKPPAGGFRRL